VRIIWQHGGRARARLGLAAGFVLPLMACSQETLFQSNFDATAIGSPPAAAQAVGTASVVGPAGSVTVVGPPAGTTGHWVQIGRTNPQQDITGLLGVLSAVRGPGRYHFLCSLFMPVGTGYASIDFEPGPQFQPPRGIGRFLHIDLTDTNQVRLDENDATRFGSFPRGQVFDLAVGIDTTVTPAMAHVALVGANASGSVDYEIKTNAYPQDPKQFGEVRIWMGYPWLHDFDATGISVTHDTQ
jgi:hypothetical protein